MKKTIISLAIIVPFMVRAQIEKLSVKNLWLYGTVTGNVPINGIASYTGNFHSSFTQLSLVDKGYVDSVAAVMVMKVEGYSDVQSIVADAVKVKLIRVLSDTRTGSTLSNTIYQLWPDNTLIYINSTVIAR